MKSGRFAATLRAVRYRFAAKGVVLMYHRIASEIVDPWGLCVSEQHFAEQLAVLNRHFHPVPLRELLADAGRRRVKHGSIAVSFDDGYADNFGTALPMLQTAGVPVTLFVTSGFIDSTEPFWWDQLALALLGPGILPRHLEIRLPDRCREWLLEDRALTIRVDNGSSEPWNAPPDSRAGFHYSLWTFMRELPDEQRRLALEQICDWAGSGPAQGRCMTRDELRRAAETAGVEIGAHSVSHADLRGLAPQARLTEAAGSKQELECLIGRGVTAFAYPFGDYDVSTMTAVREAGFEVACTADPGTVCRSTDPHAVPRIAVGDWPGEELRRRIDATLQ